MLAAGRSQRLAGATKGHSKAVLRVGGSTLAERAVNTLHRAGVEKVIVVLGHDADLIEESLAHTGADFIRADDWQLGNGASLAAAEALITNEESVAVLCADHVFSDGALDELLRSAEPAALVDPKPARPVWDEGTRVRIEGDQAVAFAKHLDAPSVDCGAFVVPTSVFASHRRAATRGDHSLSGALTELAAEEPLRVVAIPPGGWWHDVDTPDDLAAARTSVRRSLGKPTDGIVARKLNRPISTRITMALAPLRPSPTLLSIATFLIGITAAWSFSAGRGLQGGLLVQLASILDGCDGEMARLQGRSSARGAAIDALLDRLVDAAVYAGLVLWTFDDPSRWYRIIAITVVVLTWGAVARSLEDTLSPFEIPRRQEARLIGLLGGRDTRMLLLAVFSVIGLPVAAIGATAAVYVVGAAWRIVAVATGRAPRAAPAGASPAARPSPAQRTAVHVVLRAGRIILFPTVVIAVFTIVLPRIVELDRVWAEIHSLSAAAVAALIASAVLNLITYWPFIMVSLPGLTFWQAAMVCQSSTMVAMTMPAGGAVAVGVTYAMCSSWGFEATAIADSAISTFVIGMAIKLVLPAVAFLILAAQDDPMTGMANVAMIAAVAMAAAAVLVPILLRGRRTGRHVAVVVARVVNGVRRIIHKAPLAGIEARVAGFREQLAALIRARWLGLSVTGLVSQLSVFLVMLVAMRVVGIAGHEVSWAEALAVFAAVRLATSAPIIPGNVGFAELGYIGGLLVAGGQATEVVSAVLLFRFFSYFVQIPLGAATFLTWRGRNPGRLRSDSPAAT